MSADFQVGDAVIYTPHPGAPPEDGVVTGLSGDPSLVFVRYASQHPGASGQATPKARLVHLRPWTPQIGGRVTLDVPGWRGDHHLHGLTGTLVRVDEGEVYGHIVELDEPHTAPGGSTQTRIRMKVSDLRTAP